MPGIDSRVCLIFVPRSGPVWAYHRCVIRNQEVQRDVHEEIIEGKLHFVNDRNCPYVQQRSESEGTERGSLLDPSMVLEVILKPGYMWEEHVDGHLRAKAQWGLR